MKTKKTATTFIIPEALAQLINGMEATNWSTTISKNDVKVVSATFHVRRPSVEMSAVR